MTTAILNHKKLGSLIEKSKNGDEAAFQEFYECTAKFQYYRIRQILSNPADANDALQETYLLLYQRLDRIGDPTATVAYLNKLAYHVCLNHSRSNSRKERRLTELDNLENLPEKKGNPEELLLQADNANEIQKAIMELPDRERDVLILRFVQNLTLKQTAEAMKLSFSTVRRIQDSARKLLRKDLERKGLMAILPVLPIAGKNLAAMIEEQVTVPAAPETFNPLGKTSASQTLKSQTLEGPVLEASALEPAAGSLSFSSFLVKGVLAAAGTGLIISGAVNYLSSPPTIEAVHVPKAYAMAPAPVTVKAPSRLPVESCELKLEGKSFLGRAADGDLYQFSLSKNGTYTLVVKNNSGKYVERELVINCFDEGYPKAQSVKLKDKRFYVKLFDGESGIDENSVYYVTADGKRISPEYIDHSTMTAVFPATRGTNTLHFSDKCGNESVARLDY